MRHAVIMAGGTGTRLWPMSRVATPKQFQKLIGDQTLLQQTFARIRKLIPAEQIWVMTGEQYAATVAEQLPQLQQQNIITEPAARNTAAASGLTTLKILAQDPDATVAILPSDHYVAKDKVFTRVFKQAFEFVESNQQTLVTVGIHPTSPNTGYGYIQLGEKLNNTKLLINKVESFHEKPDAQTAEKYLESGQFLWNGGYFIFNAETMKAAFAKHAPAILERLTRYLAEPSLACYESIPNEPIDKAIVEKVGDLAVIPAEMGWSDIGDWAALHEILASKNKTSAVAIGEHIGSNTENSLVIGGNKLIVTVGVKDIVVIDTDDVILICDRNSAQDVKKIVEELRAKGDKTHL